MPTVTLNKKVFDKLVGKKISIDKLKERISMLGTDLESIENNEIHVEVFPNRPDMLSEQGFARAFSSFIGVKTGIRKYDVKRSGRKLYVKDLPKKWPYAVACIVRGLKLDNEKVREIIQLQEKLGTTFTRNRKKGGLGLYPLQKINFPVTFTGKAPKEIKFRPLESLKEITSSQILTQHPKGIEYGHIIETWKEYPVFIDAKNTIMSMPPIINSHDVGKIDNSTIDVFLEGTGPDLQTIKTSLAILATSLADMGGKIESIEMVYGKDSFDFPDLSPKEMDIDLKYINKHLGLDLNEVNTKKLIERMGFGYNKGKVLIPAYRADILHQVDIAEDIAIAYGYENILSEIPKVATIGQEDQEDLFINKISRILVGLGVLEVSTYTISNRKNLNEKMLMDSELIKIRNALTEEYNVVRNWITPNLLEVISKNKHNEYPQKIFEAGTVFNPDDSTETGISEFNRLGLLSTDNVSDFTYIRQILDYLLSTLNVKYEVHDTEHPSFIPGRVGRVTVNDKKIAYIGELHPQVLANWEIETPTVALELNITQLLANLE